MKIFKLFLSLSITILSIQCSFSQDWANLERFRQANSELHDPASGVGRVVFMGNSITEGWIKSRPEFFEGKPYVNRGIGGQTTPQMLLRFRQDVIDLNPSAVVILAGINDIAGNTGLSTIEMIMDNLISMAELATANNIKVVLCSVLPAKDFPWRPGLEPAEKVVQLNALLKTYAEQNSYVYVDYFSAMANDENGMKAGLTYDEVHPTAQGYAVMEPIVEAGIAKALKGL